MEWLITGISVKEVLKKYGCVFVMVLIGILLMTAPVSADKKEESDITVNRPEIQKSLEEKLEDMLCRISGAGKVKILLTQKSGERTVYQIDENQSKDSIKKETVLISGSQRNEEGLIVQVIPPDYLGALILCQGADNANVRLNIVTAVMSVTGLSSDHIAVVKMK